MTTRGEFKWTGLSTCFCANCHRLFTSADGFDRHYIMDQSTGIMECYDPETMKRQDGQPAFEKIEKPKWNPPFVWSRFSPTRGSAPWTDDEDEEDAVA